jgi:glycosyltransferase involved in cell wall biosynthesis
MSGIRLLIINDYPLIGGAEHVILNVCRHIRYHAGTGNWAVHLITSSKGPFAEAAADIPGCQVNYVDIYGLKKEWLNPGSWRIVLRSLGTVCDQALPDVILCNALWPAVVINRFCHKRDIPVICAVHAELRPKHLLKSLVFAVAGRMVTRHIDRWITVSPTLAGQLDSLGVAPDKIRLIPNGVTIPESAAVVRNGPWRTRLNIPPDAVVILAAGRLDPGKGQHMVIDAVVPLMEEGLDVYLLISGEEAPADPSPSGTQGNTYTTILHKMIEASGRESRIFLTGFVKNISGIIRESDMVISASREESFGLSILEGMAAGRAVIASDISGHRLLVENDVNGVRCNLEDPESFTAAVRRVALNTELREQMGSAGRERARAFEIEKMFHAWIEWIEGAVIDRMSRRTAFFDGAGT